MYHELERNLPSFLRELAAQNLTLLFHLDPDKWVEAGKQADAAHYAVLHRMEEPDKRGKRAVGDAISGRIQLGWEWHIFRAAVTVAINSNKSLERLRTATNLHRDGHEKPEDEVAFDDESVILSSATEQQSGAYYNPTTNAMEDEDGHDSPAILNDTFVYPARPW